MNAVFLIAYFLLFLIVSVDLMFDNIYSLQAVGYNLKDLYSGLWKRIKENYLNWFMCIVIMITMFIINFYNIYFLFIYLILEFVLIFLIGNKFRSIKKIRFTKRAIRLLLISILVFIIFDLFFLLFNPFVLTILFPSIYLISYFIVSLSVVLLFPLEKFIGNYYIKKAKEQLLGYRKLIKIGITGSFGKTSTKEILKNILSQSFYTLATPKSYNTPFGITKTILSELNSAHEVFICEMGAKKRGEISELCNLVALDYGIVTAVGRQHTSTFGGIENVYKTKKELPDSLQGKHCVFNLMNSYVKRMYSEYIGKKIGVFLIEKHKVNSIKCLIKKKIKLVLIKLQSNVYRENLHMGNVYAKNINLKAEGSEFDVFYSNEFICRAETALLGLHNVINILLSVAMAKLLNVSNENIRIGILKTEKISARYEKRCNGNNAVIINNGYNSNLDSAKYSLKALNVFDKQFKVVITPGLIECEDDYKYNYEFGKMLSEYCTDVIIVKYKNKSAMLKGLCDAGFDSDRVYFVDNFSRTQKFLNEANSEYVILIENDLPDNFK